jgi:hypothetical protein
MYDTHYRNQCDVPAHYDRMIYLLMSNSPTCQREGIDSTTGLINECIKGALDHGQDSTGMCVAFILPATGKVRLFLEPLNSDHDHWESLLPETVLIDRESQALEPEGLKQPSCFL